MVERGKGTVEKSWATVWSQTHFTAHGSDSVSSKRDVLTWPEATL